MMMDSNVDIRGLEHHVFCFGAGMAAGMDTLDTLGGIPKCYLGPPLQVDGKLTCLYIFALFILCRAR